MPIGRTTWDRVLFTDGRWHWKPPDFGEPAVSVFPMGCLPGQWHGCSAMKPDELARVCCPQCGVMGALPVSRFAVADDGTVAPRVKCLRCPWVAAIRLEGWVA